LALTGNLPFANQADPEIRRQNFDRGVYNAHVAAQHNGRPDIPAGVSAVLKRALAEQPEARYSTIREFFYVMKAAFASPQDRKPGAARIFLSYRRAEASSGWATYLESELKNRHGIDVFIDAQQVDSARRFPERLRKKIEDCDVFVCLLAAGTLESKWVQEEIRLAYENKKLMIPIFQETFIQPTQQEPLMPHIEELLNFEAVHLLDRRNILVTATVDDLARRIHESVGDLRSENRR
jgi:hypothetical protein